MKYVLRIVSMLLIATLFTLAQTSIDPGSGMAWAEGGGGGGDKAGSVNDDTSSGTTTTPKTKKVTKGSITNDFPQSKFRDIRDFQLWIAKYAKKNDLSWIATNESQLKKFVLTYEKLKNKYKGYRALELHKVFTQLKKYARQKKYPKLASRAKGMLHSFDVYDKLRYARGKYADWKKAKGIDKDIAKGEYEEAEADYYKSRGQLPRDMIMSFPVIPTLR